MICKVTYAEHTLLDAFVKEKLVVEPTCKESLRDIYLEFTKFMLEVGTDTIVKKRVFKEVIIQLWVDETVLGVANTDVIKETKENNTGIFIEGVGLKCETATDVVALIKQRQVNKQKE